eukprot:11183613-Alexandrium_andersonii.AAC.1
MNAWMRACMNELLFSTRPLYHRHLRLKQSTEPQRRRRRHSARSIITLMAEYRQPQQPWKALTAAG